VASAGGEATISTSLDGKEIHRWTGAVERISPPPMYALRTTRTPGLGIIKCAFEYRHVRLRMTRGEAKWVTEVSRTTGHSSSET
jgi:hypothetical protein